MQKVVIAAHRVPAFLRRVRGFSLLLLGAFPLSFGCGSDGEPATMEAAGGAGADADPQVPPANAAAMAAWLERGSYLEWACEPEPTVKTDGAAAIHVHNAKSRVCSNDLLAGSVLSPNEEFPRGVASVKEIHDSSGRLDVHAVAVKISDVSRGGDGWYWYEGRSLSGIGLGTCTGCHGAAGSSPDRPGAGDYVYLRVSVEPEQPDR